MRVRSPLVIDFSKLSTYLYSTLSKDAGRLDFEGTTKTYSCGFKSNLPWLSASCSTSATYCQRPLVASLTENHARQAMEIIHRVAATIQTRSRPRRKFTAFSLTLAFMLFLERTGFYREPRPSRSPVFELDSDASLTSYH